MVPDDDQPQQGRFVGGEHRFPVRVYHEDTDLSGVVYHANYLRYLERARSDMLAIAGIDQRAALAAGEGTWAVASLSIRYRAPARLGDALLVVSRVTGVRAAAVAIQQTVSRDRERLADAELAVALVSPDGRPRRQPAAWRGIFQALVQEGVPNES
ncbi:YbgC/FadM family acyl-CoA thioesterase [Sphingomonas bacterium]|uniref:YbgC/FadM family acyl-CoA thioesterase n=1 Tax=Sphingomonas bacterium TaxID=1895847 RepID=UPI0015765AB6|nr:YbgC/FadM family acyl-CoA thioesterase [Sphingomonas bacterium]